MRGLGVVICSFAMISNLVTAPVESAFFELVSKGEGVDESGPSS
jgi:hypothetical protein